MTRRRDHSSIEPGSDPTRNVARIYEGREAHGHPRNPAPARRSDPAENRHAAEQDGVRPHTKDDVFNLNVPQLPANFHDKNYDNDSAGWVRGCRSGEPTCHNEDATVKPFFDKGNAWRTDRDTGMRDQIKDYHADHTRHHSEFELRHNAGTTHATEAHDFSKRHVPSYERRGELGLGPNSEPKPRR